MRCARCAALCVDLRRVWGCRYKWNGAGLAPFWHLPVGFELYDHDGDDGTCAGGALDGPYDERNLAHELRYALRRGCHGTES